MKRRLHTSIATSSMFKMTALLVALILSVKAWAIPPSITSHPPNRSICEGIGTTFGVSALNTTSFQWEIDTGGGFVTLSNGGVYSGATTNTLTISATSLSMSGYQYRCIATGPDNPPATSNAGTLTVNANAAITVQPPTTQTICSGGNTSMSITATGSVTNYQWYIVDGGGLSTPLTNTGVYSGVNTSTLSITGITASPSVKTFTYFCTVSGSCVGATSNQTLLTVNALPAITTQPSDATTCNGNTVGFSIGATGTGLTYQWQRSFNGTTWTNLSNGAAYSGVLTNNLTVVTDMTLNNSQYRCVVNGVCTPSVTSNSGKLTVQPIMTIATQPVDKQVCQNGVTSFSIAGGTGVSPTYLWQVNNGSGWANVVNGGNYSGATSQILSLSNVPLSFDQYQYRCIITDVCSGPLTSASSKLTVLPNAVITMQPPVTQTICSGGNASMSIAATGSVTNYQWYSVDTFGTSTAIVNGGIYSGATTSTLTITGITAAPAAKTYSYFCIVSGPCVGATSAQSQLTVNALPAITAQPSDATVCNGNTAGFSISATGTGLTYQWQRTYNGTTWDNLSNAGPYSGVLTNNLTVVTDMSLNNSQYRCVVNGVCTPNTTSGSGKLTVQPIMSIVTQPTDRVVCINGSTTFSLTGAVGVSPVYQWQVNTGSGWTNVVNGPVYSGATSQNLQVNNAQLSYDQNLYRCFISDVCIGALTSASAKLTVKDNVTITSNPASSTTICSGGNASFSISATGSITNYQWYTVDGGGNSTPISDGGIYSGATTSTLTITGITAAPSAETHSYFCTVSGDCVGASSTIANLTVNALPAITTHPANKTICTGANTLYSVAATGTALSYQWQVNDGSGWTNLSNTGIYSGATSDALALTGATIAQNGYQYRCVVSGTCTPPATTNAASLTIDTPPAVTAQPVNVVICSGSNTMFSVTATGTALMYQWQVNSGSGWTNIANGGIYSNATTASLTITGATTMQDLYKYRCVVSGQCAPSATSMSATLDIETAPAITMSPSNKAVCPGGNTTYSVMASGAGLMYQWQVNTGSGWTNLANTGIYSNVATATLQITGAGVSENGNQYRCVVSGNCAPAATSAAAELNINSLPSITTQPSAVTVCRDSSAVMTVAASGTGLTYQWQVSVNNTTWGDIVNANTNTLLIPAASSAINGYYYRCVVSGTCSPAVTSDAVQITVNEPTVLTGSPANVVICPSSNTSFSVYATGTNLTYQWQVNTGSSWANVSNGGVYNGATSSKLNLANVQSSFNGYQYRCVISGACAPTPVTSSAAELTVHSNVMVNSQPAANTTICSGDSTTLSVGATGTGLSYQWYVFNGSSYVAISNGTLYAGATTSMLSIRGITAAPSAQTYLYYCKVSGTCNAVNTNNSSVLVQAKPVITSNPANKTVCDSSYSTFFNITATGSSLSYQWQVNTGSTWSNVSNGSVYAGTTTGALTLLNPYYSMNGYQYRCVVSGPCTPSAISSAATLTVQPLLTPTVTIQPNQNDICYGTLVSFVSTVNNVGTSPTYQWKVNGSNVGANSTSFSSSTLNDVDVVTCQVTSSYACPSPQALASSNAITMKVTSYQTPTISITSSSGNTECSGIPVTFTPSTTSAGNNPGYQWQVNGMPVSSMMTYTTDSLDSNDVVRCVLTSDFKCPSPSVVSSNNITMTINKTTLATVTIGNGPDTNICEKRQVIFYSYYTNSGLNPQFQWMKNGSDINGETQATYTTSNLLDGDYIQCRFISSALCVKPVVSDSLNIKIDKEVEAKVDIEVSFLGANKYIFKAIPENGGSNPQFVWYVNGVPVAYVQDFGTVNLKPSDDVYVTMTSNHPCVRSATATSRIATTGIGDNAYKFEDLSLYPNPNGGQFTIAGNYTGSGNEVVKIAIVNTMGQVVYQSEAEMTAGKMKHTVDMNSSVASGVYLLKLEIDGKQEIRRFNITK